MKRLQRILSEVASELETCQFDYGSSNTKVIFRESKFYGRQYKVYEQIDPLTERSLDFDKNYYLKNFIASNNLNRNSLTKKLIDNLFKAEKLYKKFLINIKDKTNYSNTSMTLYFNILNMLNLDDFNILSKHDELGYIESEPILANEEQKSNLEKLKLLFKSFINNNSLFKFKDLYLKFFDNYNELLKLEGIVNLHKDNSEQLLHNFFSLSALRNLSEKEQL